MQKRGNYHSTLITVHIVELCLLKKAYIGCTLFRGRDYPCWNVFKRTRSSVCFGFNSIIFLMKKKFPKDFLINLSAPGLSYQQLSWNKEAQPHLYPVAWVFVHWNQTWYFTVKHFCFAEHSLSWHTRRGKRVILRGAR